MLKCKKFSYFWKVGWLFEFVCNPSYGLQQITQDQIEKLSEDSTVPELD